MLTVNSNRFSNQFPEDIKQELLILFPVSIFGKYLFLFFSICSFFCFSNELIFTILCYGIDKAGKVKNLRKRINPKVKNKDVTYENIFVSCVSFDLIMKANI